jgi:hypothetical protein
VRITLPAESDIPELELLSVACGCKKSPQADLFDISVKFGELSPAQKKLLTKHLSYLIRRSMAH